MLKPFHSQRETNREHSQQSRITGVSGEAGSWNKTGSDSCFWEVCESHAQLALQSINPHFARLPFGMHSLSTSLELSGSTCPGHEMLLGWALEQQPGATPSWDSG